MVDAEKRVFDFLDVDGLVNCLRGLISVPSVGGQETPAQRYFAAEMLRIGLMSTNGR